MSLSKYILRSEIDPEEWKFYKLQEACNWSAEEFNFSKEKEDYENAPEKIKKLIKGIFGFFLVGDGLISDNILNFIREEIENQNWPKVYYLSMQLKIENTHAETYSKAALTILPIEEHQSVIEMCENLDCIKQKGDWIQKFIDSPESKGLRNIACAVGEGVFFVSLFAIIFYLRKLNILKNFIESNEQISKDETIHRDEKCMEAKRSLKIEEYPRAIEIIKDGVEIEKLHAQYLLQNSIESEQQDRDSGLYLENLYLYIEMLADQICYLSGLEPIYKSKADLPWMEDINMSQKTNFYERDVVGSYRGFDPNEALTEGNKKDDFSLNEDF